MPTNEEKVAAESYLLVAKQMPKAQVPKQHFKLKNLVIVKSLGACYILKISADQDFKPMLLGMGS